MIKELSIILANESNIKELNIDQIIYLLQNDYSDAFALNNPESSYLFRGDNRQFNASIIQPRYRESIGDDNINFYTTLFSESLPSWKKYPKRNHCIICINDINQAKTYGKDGNTYIIFPKNNTKLGICPRNDLLISFSKFINPLLDYMITGYESLMGIFWEYIFNEKPFFKSNDDIQILCNKLDEIKENISLRDEITEHIPAIKKILAQEEPTIEYFNNIFDPKLNNFSLVDTKNLTLGTQDSHEVWFDNDALAIEYKYFERIKQGL